MKKLSLMRRGLLAGTVLVAGGGALIAGAIPAGASNKEVTASGSFTTYDVMNALFPASLNNLLPGGSGTVAATASLCTGGTTYTNNAPNGSSAGKDALKAEESGAANRKGCLTFARSSSAPKPSTAHTSANFDYYAYALDGVAPMVGSDSGALRDQVTSTPATWVTLTVTDMRHIYHCDAGYRAFGGATGASLTAAFPNGTGSPIVRFWPQTGSGTRSMYKDILGFTPSVAATKGSCATPAITSLTVGGTPKVNEENTESGIIYAGNQADAIYIYSAGKFAQEWNTTTNFGPTVPNAVTAGAPGGNFTTRTTPTGRLLLANMHNTSTGGSTAFVTFTAGNNTYALDTNVVKEANEWYSHMPSATSPASGSSAPVAGVRYIYNVADTALPSYNGVKLLVGFDNKASGVKSLLCNGNDSSTITAQGFVALGTGGPSGSNAAGSTCREFPGGAYPIWASPIAKHWLP